MIDIVLYLINNYKLKKILWFKRNIGIDERRQDRDVNHHMAQKHNSK